MCKTLFSLIVAAITSLVGVTIAPPALAGFSERAIVRTVTGSGRGDGRLSTAASVIQVNALATDSRGNIYIVDRFDHRVRRVDRRTGIISTVAGTGIAGNGPASGRGETVALNFPSDISIDDQDRVVIADSFNFVLRRYDPSDGQVSVIAGSGTCCTNGDGGLASDANLHAPFGVHVAENQDIYVSEGAVVRRIRAVDGVIETVAGISNMTGDSGDGGPAIEATMTLPTFLTTDNAGRLYINDLVDDDLRVVDLETGIIDSLQTRDPAGNRLALTDARALQFDMQAGQLLVVQDPGYYRVDPESAVAELVDLELLAANSLAITPTGNLLISNLAREVFALSADTGARRSIVTSVQPSECSETLDSALLFSPKGIAVGPDGLVYVADQSLGFVASIDEVAGTVTAVAGRRGALSSIVGGDGGSALEAMLAVVVDIDFDPQGRLVLATSSAIRRVDLEQGTIATVGGGGSLLPDQTADPIAAAFPDISAIAIDGQGRYYVAVTNAIYRISAAGIRLERIAGGPMPGDSGDGGPAIDALLDDIKGLAADAAGNLYVADSGNNRIRIIAADSGEITTVAGTGEFFPLGDGGPALAAGLSLPQGIALSRNEQVLFVAESARIRAVNLQTGVIDTIAGTGEAGTQGDGGPANDAQLSIPVRMAEDRFGNLYFSELGRQRVRVIERLGSGVRLPFEIDPGDAFGSAISASGQRFAVGIPSDVNTPRGSGTVAIYRNDDCRLVLEDRIVPPQQLALQGFGRSITLDADNLLVGGLSRDVEGKGLAALQAALFERVGSDWQFKQPIGSSSSEQGDAFGAAVAMDGNTMVVGAPQADDGTGAAYVFTNEGGLWTERLRVGGDTPGDAFGSAVDVKGDVMAIGAPGSQVGDGTTGSVSLYDQITNNLTQTSQVTSPGGALTQGFGASVALSETAMIVGAPDSDDGPDNSGSVYLFDDGGANAVQLVAGELNTDARLGAAVDIDETVAFVGAPGLVDAAGGRGGVFGFSLDEVRDIVAKGGSASSALQKIDPAFYQQGLGASISVNDGRAFAGAPETGGSRGDAVALQLIANLGAASGLWFDPALEGEGFNIVTTTAGAIVYYYGYTGSGERLWLVSDLIPSLGFGTPVSANMFDSNGGTFAAPVASAQGIEPWGRLQITYDTTTSAVIELFGVEGSKVSRTVKLVDARGSDGGYSGLWFDPDLEGEGYNVIASSVGTIVYYYGFSASGERLWLVSDVITEPLGGAPISVTLFEARGGTFASPAPSAQSLAEWGELTLSFDDCDHARFQISGSDGNKTSDTVRLAGIAGQVCDQ